MADGPVIDPRITVRFGDALLSHGYTAVPNLVLKYYRQAGITDGEMMFTIHVWQYWWSAQNPYPSVGLIAERMEKTTRQIRNYIEGLRGKDLLRVLDRFDSTRGGVQLSNEFDFTPFIERILALAKEAGDLETVSRESGVRRVVRAQAEESFRVEAERNFRGEGERSVRGRRKAISPEEDTVEKDSYGRKSDPYTIWQAVLAELRAGMTPSVYKRWFSGTMASTLVRNVLTVSVPTTTLQRALDQRLRPKIEATLATVGYPEIQVIFAARAEEASS